MYSDVRNKSNSQVVTGCDKPQCCQLGVFSAQLSRFLLRCEKFLTVAGCGVWASFINVGAFFWTAFSKYFAMKEHSLYQCC